MRGTAAPTSMSSRLHASGLGTVRARETLAVTVTSLAAAAVLSGWAPSSLGVLALLACAGGLLLVAPAHVLAGAVVIGVGAFQLSDAHPLQAGPVSLYVTDVLATLLIVRAVIPKERLGAASLPLVAQTAALTWVAAIAMAAIRGQAGATPIDTLVRLTAAATYPVVFYIGAREVLREKDADIDRIIRVSAAAVVGFVCYMLFERVAGNPFEQVNALGRVVTASGEELRRDFGFASAFILYPVLALWAFAYALVRSSRAGAALAAVGIVATGLTLIRGETYGLLLGIAAVVAVATPWTAGARQQAIMRVASLLAATGIVVALVSPSLSRGVIERSVPGLAQEGTRAQETAQFRADALRIGLQAAEVRPLGTGFVSEQRLQALGLDPRYLNHSAPSWLLSYAGWPGLLAGVAALMGLFVGSSIVPDRRGWVHPAFLGTGLMLAAYSMTASGLVGQPWVMALWGCMIAFRFAPASAAE